MSYSDWMRERARRHRLERDLHAAATEVGGRVLDARRGPEVGRRHLGAARVARFIDGAGDRWRARPEQPPPPEVASWHPSRTTLEILADARGDRDLVVDSARIAMLSLVFVVTLIFGLVGPIVLGFALEGAETLRGAVLLVFGWGGLWLASFVLFVGSVGWLGRRLLAIWDERSPAL